MTWIAHSSLGLKWLLGPVASVTMVLKWVVTIMLMFIPYSQEASQHATSKSLTTLAIFSFILRYTICCYKYKHATCIVAQYYCLTEKINTIIYQRQIRLICKYVNKKLSCTTIIDTSNIHHY